MTSPILVFDDIKKNYGKTEALRGVSFSVYPGEFVGLLGPNGSGKSTLFQIAAGLFAPDGGEVSVFGKNFRQNGTEILKDLGVVFQARSVDLDMSVKANLKFHGRLFGLSGKLLEQRIAEVSEQLEIAPLLKKLVRTLSGGNQRRVEIARAMLNRPKLLLMDEPSLGLDARTRQRLAAQRLAGVEDNVHSLLWATHMVEELDSADRIIVLLAGKVLRDTTPAAMLAETGAASLTEAYITLTGVTPVMTGEKVSP